MRPIEKKNFRRVRRTRRVRGKVVGTLERPRLVVIRSLKNMYAQVVDDTTGATLCAANTLQSSVADSVKTAGNVAAAKAVGKAIAEAALAKNIKKVCFDRGGRKYHGRVKALADSAREAGLQF